MDRLPPCSIEAEQGVLGCCLLSPDAIAECVQTLKPGPDAFYDMRHQKLYAVLAKMHDRREIIDLITVHKSLRDAKLLDDTGGLAYISGLQEKVPSAVSLSYYLEIVLEKYRLRKIVQTCTRIAGLVMDNTAPVEDLMFSVNSDLGNLLDLQNSTSEIWTADELLNYDFAHDKNAIIGVAQGDRITRYLCRGYGAFLIGQSHLGKSSLAMQMAILWNCGRPFCGLTPVRPLRILYIQAENDRGDAAEQFQGVIFGTGIDAFSKDFGQIMERFKFITERGAIGLKFCRWLERQIIAHRADVVIVDPLLSFGGFDVSRQEQCTEFLRAGLNPVLASTGAILIAAHHTGKPKQDNSRNGHPQTLNDLMYSGIGSSELVNWARVIMLLRSLDEETKTFQLDFVKRGNRAGATHPDGQPTQKIYLRHAKDKVFWEQIAPPEEQPDDSKPKKKTIAERVIAQNTSSFLTGCPAEGESQRAVCRRLCNWLASKAAPDRIGGQSETGRPVREAVAMLVDADKLSQKDGRYYRGANA